MTKSSGRFLGAHRRNSEGLVSGKEGEREFRERGGGQLGCKPDAGARAKNKNTRYGGAESDERSDAVKDEGLIRPV